MKSDMQIRQEISHLRKQLRERKRKAHGEPKRKKGMGVRIGDRDDAEKVRRGYVEAGSYVRRDGSEKLVGRDWRKRVDELRERAEGRCQMSSLLYKPHAYDCRGDGDDPHHKIKRSVRRDDRLSNLALISRPCHIELDERKIRSGKVGA